jgi:hypothetical protein
MSNLMIKAALQVTLFASIFLQTVSAQPGPDSGRNLDLHEDVVTNTAQPPESIREHASRNQGKSPRNSWGSRSFWTLTGIATGSMIADVELSQACLQRHTCSEANPLMPESRAKAYAIQVPLTFATSYLSYRMRKKGSARAWLPEVGLLVGHSVGIASGLRFAF